MSDPVNVAATAGSSSNSAGGQEEEQQQQQPEVISYTYSCRMCRHVLFHQPEVVPHDNSKAATGNKAFRRRWIDGDEREEVCTSYFLDPDQTAWVSEESREAVAAGLEVSPDTIYCPNVKCHAKIGSQSWTGAQCSCGSWVTPAFKVLGKAVDKLPVYATQDV